MSTTANNALYQGHNGQQRIGPQAQWPTTHRTRGTTANNGSYHGHNGQQRIVPRARQLTTNRTTGTTANNASYYEHNSQQRIVPQAQWLTTHHRTTGTEANRQATQFRSMRHRRESVNKLCYRHGSHQSSECTSSIDGTITKANQRTTLQAPKPIDESHQFSQRNDEGAF